MDSVDWTQLGVFSIFGVIFLSIIVLMLIALRMGTRQSRQLADLNDSFRELIALMRERR
ncbi:MAG TPA: hypothetical protein VEI07_06995 [Planctomycetaceae bacterium]|nr:hypothetical protein [Planctomycetaceae bacterium]